MKRFFIASTFVFIGFLFGLSDAFAGPSHNLTGYAWSGNVGWISFNSSNTGDAVDYGVNLDGSGNITGYAWSPNVGWIQFGGLSGFPVGSGTTASNATVSGSQVVGWARALSHGGGWDGWISLRGTGYGVSYSNGAFSGYAWGSDVIGWVLFDVQNVYPSVCTNCGVTLSGDASLDVRSGGVSIVGSTSVPHNTMPTFLWSLANIPSATCSVTKESAGGPEFSPINDITSNGSFTGAAHPGPVTYTYAIACSNPTILKQVTFTVVAEPPSFSLGGPESANIQFLASGAGESEQKNFYVTAAGGFTGNVSVTVDTGASTCPSAMTTYSLGGSNYASSTSPVVISSPYDSGSSLRVRISGEISTPCVVRLVGTATGGYSAIKDITVTPYTANPGFIEF